ncbi:MAG: hypothetical protein PSY12_03120, partial [bacterium]|nr:hypothetical protein [bacterium]
DVAVVDEDSVAFGSDLVFNRPDLSNRPIRLLAGSLTVGQMTTLCRTHRVAFVDRNALRAIRQRIDAKPGDGRHFAALQGACGRMER